METVWKDLRFAARMLLRKPGFTAASVVALALGIGANTAIFSVVKAVLLSPLPYAAPERLVWVWETNPTSGIKTEPASLPNYNDWRNQSASFEGMAAYFNNALTLTSNGEPERVPGAYVSANFFPLLGVEPALGRGFAAEENTPGKHRVAVISHALWQRRFGGDPGVTGQTVTLNGNPYAVVGVMPPDFRNPTSREQQRPAEIWAPLAFDIQPAARRSDFLSVVARLKPGVGIEQARAEMDTITARLAQQYPATNEGWATTLLPLHERLVGDVRLALWVLMGVVGFLLLIACANVANLLLARSAARQQELAVRTALGAGRARLVRQLLTESVLLALAGGATGALLAMWGIELLRALSPGDIPRLDEVGLDWKVLSFAFGVSLLTGVVFGLLPALQSTNPNLTETLKEGGRSATEGGRRRRLRNSLVVSEIAIALVLLIGAGLMIRSFMNLQAVDPGFRPERVLAMDVSLPSKYKDDPQVAGFYDQLLDRVAAMPGVESAAAASALPLVGGDYLSFTIEGRPDPPPSQVVDAEYRVVSPEYFAAMGIALVRGQGFTARDTADAPRVTVISETMARKFWPGEDPIGKRINLGNPQQSPWRTIVGVVKDVRGQELSEEPYPQMYAAYAQFPRRGMTILARTATDPLGLVPSVRRELSALDKDQPLYNVRTLEQVVRSSVGRQRFQMMLLVLFAVVGLVLAAVGIYGVISYTVAQRTHEIGLRVALGAQSGDILRMVVGQGMAVVGVGVVVGLVGAFLLTRVMSSLLFGVSPTDVVTFAGIPLLLTLVALAASYLPARRAMRVDPMVALRYE